MLLRDLLPVLQALPPDTEVRVANEATGLIQPGSATVGGRVELAADVLSAPVGDRGVELVFFSEDTAAELLRGQPRLPPMVGALSLLLSTAPRPGGRVLAYPPEAVLELAEAHLRRAGFAAGTRMALDLRTLEAWSHYVGAVFDRTTRTITRDRDPCRCAPSEGTLPPPDEPGLPIGRVRCNACRKVMVAASMAELVAWRRRMLGG